MLFVVQRRCKIERLGLLSKHRLDGVLEFQHVAWQKVRSAINGRATVPVLLARTSCGAPIIYGERQRMALGDACRQAGACNL